MSTLTADAARTNLAAARLRAASLRPYYAAALLDLKVIRTNSLERISIDREAQLRWSPEACAFPVQQLAVELVHDLEHLLRDHAGRGDAWVHRIGADRWHLACDLELATNATDLGPAVVTPLRLGLPNGLLAEEYAELLAEQAPELTRASLAEARATAPRRAPSVDGRGADVGTRTEPTRRNLPGLQAAAPSEVDDRAERRLQAIRVATARAALDAATEGVGIVPAGVARWAGELAGPKVDWRRELRALLHRSVRRVSGNGDHCFARPSRRSPARVILPRLRDRVLDVALVIDTSASITDDQLALARDQVQQLVRGVAGGGAVTVISCDSEVQAVQQVRNGAGVRLVGGGGSDLTPGIDAAVEAGAGVVIVITDGEVAWPTQAPRVPVIIGLLPGSDRRFGRERARIESLQIPEWARVIELDDLDARPTAVATAGGWS